MAKKRVYEIAKEKGVTSKDLIAALKAAGIEVKAAASTVDEADATRALSSGGAGNGKPSAPAAKPAAAKPAPAKQAARPAGDKQAQAKPAAKPAAAKPQGSGEAKPAPKQAPAQQPQDGRQSRPGQQGGAPSQGGRPGGQAPAPRDGGAPRPQRPAQGRPGGGTGGRRRRVVIDSQASRRQAPHPPPPQRRRRSRGRGAPPPEPSESNQATAVAEPEAIRIPSGATVRDVAEHLGIQVSDVIKKLMQLGEMASITQTLSDEAIGVIADEFDKKIEVVTASQDETPAPVFDDAEADLSPRPPVVTIMGHVDHGKTSLLDSIRETEVAAGEAGGITQHIGAYQVHHGGKIVTFLDTPGHEAFTAMRARGAKVTDIAVIVVAADDGVMPQTTEAIDHAKAAGVPMVIAVNKIDKDGAQPERVRGELGGQGLTPEEWGGDTIFCDVSAKTKDGLDNLLDMILLVSEVEELKANADAPASGHVIESKLDPGRGPVVTVLVQRGTLETGDALVAGAHWGRVRAMHDFLGQRAKKAMPGEPVEVLGFDTVPDAGEPVRVVGNDREARHLAGERAIRLKTEALARRKSAPVSLEDVFDRVKEGEAVALNIVLKADVAGSLEALQDQLAKVSTSQVGLNVLHTGVGGITQSDVMLAAASGAVIIGFNVRPLPEAKTLADQEGVEIRSYTVIYKVTEELRAAMEGMLEPEEVEESLGMAEVRQTFRASRIGTIAGSHVVQGKITRGAKVRLVREGTIIYDGSIASLKRFKDDAREVEEGFECGIVLENYNDVKDGDVIEAYETRKVAQTLE
ncbi:MAG TPA: translation initiation factor IF-2 [Solirubrobacterales bacterium]|nr:translation initiation factor IF-2 [Solirubrobacterales bacterium]